MHVSDCRSSPSSRLYLAGNMLRRMDSARDHHSRVKGAEVDSRKGAADMDGCLALQLQLHLQRLYLADLERIQRLCVRLDLLRGDDATVRRLKEMHVKHIRPLVHRLKAPKSQLGRSEMAWLMKMSRVLPPFLKELDCCFKELQEANEQAFVFEMIHSRVAAAAA